MRGREVWGVSGVFVWFSGLGSSLNRGAEDVPVQKGHHSGKRYVLLQ